ncbi:MAG: tRNA pseudouridine(38-40) synthase TruA [Lachnospiraceae bacterium]|nr:tRNA pseudouridine(38-40) synthase TruA [Lachnospiraceae bacterium]
MKRVKMIVAYDGTDYCGWQLQNNGITIEEVLNHHLSELLGEPIHVIGASRTDAGVHAEGNVAVFDTNARMAADRICYAMNTRLPGDIRIVDSMEVPADFHPRFCHTVKTYRYQISNRRFPNPLNRRYSLHYYWNLDEEKMQRGADYLVGEHDFTSFCTNNPAKPNHVRTIYEIRVERQGDMVSLYITGNGFLYNMVRIIAGTLLLVGTGKIEPEEVGRILEAKDRQLAGDTARPEGLTLMEIRYVDGNDRWQK